MSISTRKGDDGTTSLMYGKRVPKNHPQVEAYGAYDELSSMLGLARGSIKNADTRDLIYRIQKDLICLMGHLAVHPDDTQRYAESQFPRLKEEALEALDLEVHAIEKSGLTFQGFEPPGGSLTSGSLEMARALCRKAERLLVTLGETGFEVAPLIRQYTNRLSDLLWLLAQKETA